MKEPCGGVLIQIPKHLIYGLMGKHPFQVKYLCCRPDLKEFWECTQSNFGFEARAKIAQNYKISTKLVCSQGQ